MHKDIIYVFPIYVYIKYVTQERGNNLNKLGRDPFDDATYIVPNIKALSLLKKNNLGQSHFGAHGAFEWVSKERPLYII